MSIRSTLHRILIAPRQRDEDARNRELVLNVLLCGAFFLSLFVLLMLLIKIVIMDETYMIARALAVSIVCAFVGTLYGLSRRGLFKTTSYILIGIYFSVATALIIQWGIGIPTANLLYGLVIVLSGILLGSVFSLGAAALVAVTMTSIQIASEKDLITPDWSWTTSRPGMTDVFGFVFIFAIIALVSWLFNRQMERSLHKAERAEAALLKQKALLETTVEKRTQQLQTAQLEKIQQMYRFAELGQLSTAMMHDLSNHLTSLTLNIESLRGEKRSKVLADVKRSIRHIDEMVVRVRDQLQGRAKMRSFCVATEIDNMVGMLRHRGHLANVQLNWEQQSNKKALTCWGDPIRFRQMIANLITNGFDAYDKQAKSDERREVLVTAAEEGPDVVITVNDWGRGIPDNVRPKLFEPFHSTKQTGMGMGLFIVKQIVEEHFLGTVTVDTSQQHTALVVRLPKADQ